MKNHPKISKLLVEDKGYRDVDPCILASGVIGIYYINTENLLRDGGEWSKEKYKNNSRAMIEHSIKMMREQPTFEEVIKILAGKVEELSPDTDMISGGQRRDWLFSGPVAYVLGIPHISIYKNGKVEAISTKQRVVEDPNIKGRLVVHIADLLTEGSSTYRREGGREEGWITEIRSRGATVDDYVVVVDRLQRREENERLGREMLEDIGLDVTSFVAIDEGFLIQNSRGSERAIAYQKNPGDWSREYLRKNGASAFIETFDPKEGKLERVGRFIQRYERILKDSGNWGALEMRIKDKYDVSLVDIRDGRVK